LESSIVLVDSQPVNLFAQTFTPGDTLTFTLTLTTNVDSGDVPDGFVFYILDRTGTSIPTFQGPPLNELLAVYLTSANPSVQTFATNPTQAPAAGGSPINITPQINVQSPPPGLSFAVYATWTGCGALSFFGGAYTDSFNSSLGSYSQTKQLANGNVGVSGNIDLVGPAVINGAISTLSPTVGICTQQGQNGAPGITLWGNAQATGGYMQMALSPSFPSPAAATAGTQNYDFSADGSLPPGNYNNIIVSGHHTLTLSPGAYDIDSITLGEQSVLSVSPPGQVIVNVAGNQTIAPVVFEAGSTVNGAGSAGNFELVYGGSKPIFLSLGVMCYARLYAPNSLVILSAGSQWFGAMVVRNLLAWNGSAIHYDSSPLP
jgi:hypothetical protein